MSITTVEAVAGPVGAEADPAGVGAVAGPEVRPARQVYSAAYKLKVLAELDAADSKSARGEIVRREGLYSSLVSEWRNQRDRGALEAMGQRPASPSTSARQTRAVIGAPGVHDRLDLDACDGGALLGAESRAYEVVHHGPVTGE